MDARSDLGCLWRVPAWWLLRYALCLGFSDSDGVTPPAESLRRLPHDVGQPFAEGRVLLVVPTGCRYCSIVESNLRLPSGPRDFWGCEMKIVGWSLLFFVAATLPIPCSAGELWQGAETGADPKEILAMFPDSILVPEPREYRKGDALVAIDNRPVGRFEFDVRFVFGGGGLSEVELIAAEKLTGERPGAIEFSEIEMALAAKYGAPVWTFSSDQNTETISFLETREYFLGGLTVNLTCVLCGEALSNLTVSYYERRGSLEDGL